LRLGATFGQRWSLADQPVLAPLPLWCASPLQSLGMVIPGLHGLPAGQPINFLSVATYTRLSTFATQWAMCCRFPAHPPLSQLYSRLAGARTHFQLPPAVGERLRLISADGSCAPCRAGISPGVVDPRSSNGAVQSLSARTAERLCTVPRSGGALN